MPLWWVLAVLNVRTRLQVRSIAIHPSEYTFASASPDNIKKWKCPEGKFLHNITGHNAIVNALAINEDNVMAAGADNGKVHMYDWKTGHNYQTLETIAQPGSLESERAIFSMAFDHSGSRLITGEADKTIKIWKEDPDATPGAPLPALPALPAIPAIPTLRISAGRRRRCRQPLGRLK